MIAIAARNRKYQSMCSFTALTVELDAPTAGHALKAMKHRRRTGGPCLSSASGDVHLTALDEAVVRNAPERTDGTARLTFDDGGPAQVRR